MGNRFCWIPPSFFFIERHFNKLQERWILSFVNEMILNHQNKMKTSFQNLFVKWTKPANKKLKARHLHSLQNISIAHHLSFFLCQLSVSNLIWPCWLYLEALSPISWQPNKVVLTINKTKTNINDMKRHDKQEIKNNNHWLEFWSYRRH